MRFPPSFLDELRARLPVSDVVGRRVKLKKAGREWKGLSPFQQEKTPSFTVNDQKGFYHDFSSGKHGDIFGFVMETEGVTFAEAVERLAAMAGMAVPQVSPQEEKREQRRRTLHDVMDLAATFFADTLAARAGAKARGYLADRGLDAQTQVRFRLGYAPSERFALKEFLGGKGVSTEDMIEAGLLIAGEDIPVPFDRFRDRVMFPITDARGRVIAFGGRALDKDVPAKYLNSPETPLFHKGETLYNIAAARQAAHAAQSTQAAQSNFGAAVIAVEGYVDVIAMCRAGFAATVAPLGTALTEHQLGLLWRMADEPILCFDGDKAGQRAAWRAADLALPLLAPGRSLRFALLPQGQDPDDLIRTGGRSAMEDVLGAAQPLAEMLWRREIEGGSFATPERRAALEARLNEIAGGIRDEVVRKYYRQDLQNRLRTLFQPAPAPSGGPGGFRRDSFRAGPGGFVRNPSGTGRGGARGSAAPAPAGLRGPYQVASPQLGASAVMRGQTSAISPREALIVQALLNHPWLLHDHLEEVGHMEFANPEVQRLVRGIVAAFSHYPASANEDAVRARLRNYLEHQGFSQVIQRVDRAVTNAAVWGAQAEAAHQDVILTWRQLVFLHHQRNSLTKELKEAELALASDPTEAHFAWLKDVQTRLSAVDGIEALVEGFGAASGRIAGGM